MGKKQSRFTVFGSRNQGINSYRKSKRVDLLLSHFITLFACALLVILARRLRRGAGGHLARGYPATAGIPTLDLKWRDTNRISPYWSFGITASEPLPEPIALRINMLAHVYDAGEIRKVWYKIDVTFKQGDLNT